uniref:Uncharacterized protein n=2 Tax=Physcomitrium patens TaxID=3218 RepID=A0A2K1KCD3_PHYPA|nr:hypothetical protein PHYPA_010596 [Physcomitrium patens]
MCSLTRLINSAAWDSMEIASTSVLPTAFNLIVLTLSRSAAEFKSSSTSSPRWWSGGAVVCIILLFFLFAAERCYEGAVLQVADYGSTATKQSEAKFSLSAVELRSGKFLHFCEDS